MSFMQISPEQISQNPFSMIGKQWMLVTAGDKEKMNTMTASWGGVGVMWGKNVAVTVIRPQRYTLEFLEQHDLFTLSFLPEQYRPALNLCGTKSGRDLDKIAAAGLTPVFEQDAPYFEEASLVLVCRKLYVSDVKKENFLDAGIIDKWYPASDFHRMFVAEIVSALKKGNA